jgi:hypothetical protein
MTRTTQPQQPAPQDCCAFELADDEALIVEVRPPRARYWSLHCLDHWFSALDYANFHARRRSP